MSRKRFAARYRAWSLLSKFGFWGFLITVATTAASLLGALGLNLPRMFESQPRVLTLHVGDGSTELSTSYGFGCLRNLDAIPKSNLPRHVTIDPTRAQGRASVAPIFAYAILDTDMPAGDYLRISAIDLGVEEYASAPEDPPMFFTGVACADGATIGTNDYAFRAIVSPDAKVRLLESPGDSGPLGSTTLRQNLPRTAWFDFIPRQSGWYTISVKVTYTYRGRREQVWGDRQIRVFFPSHAPAKMYAQGSDREFHYDLRDIADGDGAGNTLVDLMESDIKRRSRVDALRSGPVTCLPGHIPACRRGP